MLVATVVLGITPAPAQTPTQSATRGWQDEVREMLRRRADAVVSGDEAAFMGTMRDAPSGFRSDRQTWFRRSRALPIGVYRLDFAEDEFGEVTRPIDRAHHAGREVHVIQVKQRIGFRGYDARSSAEDLFLTVVKGDQGWSVVADDEAESLALQSTRELWDFGAVAKLESEGIMIVFHPSERAAAARLLTLAKAARARVRQLWPLPWKEDRIVIMIPTTVSELARILQTTFDLSTFVAFAAASVDREKTWQLSGSRIFLHWPNFRRQGEASQRIILQHEFLHRASFEVSGPNVASIFDEGIAQYYGEALYNPPTPELRQRVRSRRFDRHLVRDFVFTIGPPSDIYLAYEEAVDFIAYIGRRFGRNAGARLFRALGSENPVAPGTWRYHLDRACRSVLKAPFSTLERDWARTVVRELS
ncbi:MAG: hypothetical protein WAT66_07345 [Actinomycetota bacterium]